jgi:hypothetical protein
MFSIISASTPHLTFVDARRKPFRRGFKRNTAGGFQQFRTYFSNTLGGGWQGNGNLARISQYAVKGFSILAGANPAGVM